MWGAWDDERREKQKFMRRVGLGREVARSGAPKRCSKGVSESVHLGYVRTNFTYE